MARRARSETHTASEPARGPAAVSPQPVSHYTVLARRYRPQQFADLVGQEALVQALTNALRSQRVAHAYLFTGARGVGKTSTARILAKCLNCVHGPTVTPCDQCESCRAIAVGEDVDVIEIDGASNNRVEEIRELRSNAQYRPTRSRYKIYIIDEVHMLTTSAFNALLKTLEEPPPHVKFIFATTEVHKVPLTILSRCQRFDFASIRVEDIVKQLRMILDREGLAADEETLKLIARRAAGSLRDAESILDQALAFADGRLTRAQVEQLLGLAGEEHILALAEAILDRDTARAWTLLDEALRRGVQPGELLDQLLEYWRDLLLLQTVGETCEAFTYADRHLDRLKRRAQAISLDSILTVMDLIAGTKGRLRGSSHPRVLVEMLLVRLTQLESLASISELLERLSLGDARVRPEEPSSGRPGSSSTPGSPKLGAALRPFVSSPPAGKSAPTARSGATSDVSETARAPDQTSSSTAQPLEGPLPPGSTAPSPGQPVEPVAGSSTDQLEATRLESEPIELCEAHLPRLRQALLDSLGTSTLRFDLERATLAISAPNCLALRFPAPYNAAKSRCERRQVDLLAALRRILRRNIQLRFEIQDAVVPKPSTETMRQDRLKLLEKIPLIREAMQQLGAQLVPERVDPIFGQEELQSLTEAHS